MRKVYAFPPKRIATISDAVVQKFAVMRFALSLMLAGDTALRLVRIICAISLSLRGEVSIMTRHFSADL
ncbi:hypothetical protein KXR87_21915 [Yokenella regensburgei]|uniref:hypothetical protein n=1 Tax=Yokenella regensburgei TaxID=158877 RepID=UPI003F173927